MGASSPRIREPPANFYGGGPPPSPPVAVFRTTDTPWEGHVTSVALAPDGSRLLASWSGHHIFEFLVQDAFGRVSKGLGGWAPSAFRLVARIFEVVGATRRQSLRDR